MEVNIKKSIGISERQEGRISEYQMRISMYLFKIYITPQFLWHVAGNKFFFSESIFGVVCLEVAAWLKRFRAKTKATEGWQRERDGRMERKTKRSRAVE